MIDGQALLANAVILWLSGFLIGVGLKTIIDGFAARDDDDRKFGSIEGRLEVLEEQAESLLKDMVGFPERLAKLETRFGDLDDVINDFDERLDDIEDQIVEGPIDETDDELGPEPDCNSFNWPAGHGD